MKMDLSQQWRGIPLLVGNVTHTLAPSGGHVMLQHVPGPVCSAEAAAAHWGATPVLRGPCQQGPEGGDPLVPRAAPRGQELQDLLCSHGKCDKSSGLLVSVYSYYTVNRTIFLMASYFPCSPIEHTIWWTPVETLTSGVRKSRKCGERSITNTKILAYRRAVPPVTTPSS